jgi:hypothetical protein
VGHIPSIILEYVLHVRSPVAPGLTLKERTQLVLSVVHLRHHRFWESFEQSRCGSEVLARSGKEWGSIIVFKDPPVDVAELARARPPSLQRPISRSSLACSCSSLRHASSSSFCCSRSYSNRTHGGVWFLSWALSSETFRGVFPSWTLSTCPSGGCHEALPRVVMSSPAGVGVRDRLRFPREKVLEGLRDVVRHP